MLCVTPLPTKSSDTWSLLFVLFCVLLFCFVLFCFGSVGTPLASCRMCLSVQPYFPASPSVHIQYACTECALRDTVVGGCLCCLMNPSTCSHFPCVGRRLPKFQLPCRKQLCASSLRIEGAVFRRGSSYSGVHSPILLCKTYKKDGPLCSEGFPYNMLAAIKKKNN